MLNSRQVEELFERGAIIIGDSDVMPFSVAIESVGGGDRGELAFEVTLDHMDAKKDVRLWGDFDTCYSAACFTLEGFRCFVSYANILELKHINAEAPAKDGKVIDIRRRLIQESPPKTRASRKKARAEA